MNSFVVSTMLIVTSNFDSIFALGSKLVYEAILS